MTHFVAEESFLNKYFTILFRYNSSDLSTVAFFSAERLTIISKMDIKFQPSTQWIMEIISLKSNERKRLTKQKFFTMKKGLYTNRDLLELFLECHFSLISL